MSAIPARAPATNEGPAQRMTTRRVNTRLASYNDDDYFGYQPTARDDLPDPTTLVENLARSVLEIIAGARDLDQIARWVSDDVYRHLAKRVQIAVRARSATGAPPVRPTFTLGRTIITEPSDGVVEAVVIIHGRARTRSVAFRLEGLDGRWRATAVHVL
jgi:hypothetical protein